MLWGARGIGLARSRGPAFDTWTKFEASPVIRSTEWGVTEVKDSAGVSKPLEDVVGDACELGMEIDVATAQRCGLKVRTSRNGEEETLLYYDAVQKALVFDSTRSGEEGRKVVERAPLVLKPGEALKLRVFVDKSVVEVYANDRQAIGRRVYPTLDDSLGVALFTAGGSAHFQSVRAWDMMPANPF